MKQLTIIFFLLFISSNLFSQNEKALDSLVNVYNSSQDSTKLPTLQALYEFHIRTDLNKSLMYALEEITLASKLDNDYFLFLGNFNLGQYYYLNEKRDTARTYLNKALAFTKNARQLKNDVLINSLVARLHYYNVEDSIALNVLDKNLALQDSLNLISTNTYGNDLLLKAMIYQIQDNIEKQLDNAQKALKIFETNNNQLKKADALRIISGADVQVGDLKKGLDRELQALEIYKKHHDKKRTMITLSRIGSLYVVLDKRPLAKTYFEEVLLNAKEQNLPEW
jgi:tetratricopeptide (TPR) repeat protein